MHLNSPSRRPFAFLLAWSLPLVLSLPAQEPAAGDVGAWKQAAEAAAKAGDPNKAAAAWRKVTELAPKDGQAWHMLGYTLHMAGNLDAALEAHLAATRFPGVAAAASYNVACVHALRGKPDEAFPWLDKAIAAGFADADLLSQDGDLDSLRKDPRFAKVAETVKTKAAAGMGALQAYVQNVARRNTRIAWFGRSGSPGQVSLDYSPVPWQADYEAQLGSGKLQGKVWRLGADFWTRLDTSVDLQVGEVAVPAGYYYVTAAQTAPETFVLQLHDAAAVRKQHLDAYLAGKLTGGLTIPLQHRAADSEAKELAIDLASGESIDQGSLTIRFGKHVLQAPLVAKLK